VKILLSWSGESSRALATFLREWLPRVLSGVEPWMSDKDIGPGQIWFDELMESLLGVQAGIVCVTRENVTSPWIHFEAGCLAAKFAKGLLCPYLVGMKVSDLGRSPLGSRQCVSATKEGTWQLVSGLNKLLRRRQDDGPLSSLFDLHWPELEEVIRKQTTRSSPSGLRRGYSNELYEFGGHAISYIPIVGSRMKDTREYRHQDIKVEIDRTHYELPSAFHSNPTDVRGGDPRCGVSLFSPEQISHTSPPKPPTFRFRKIDYADYVRSFKYLDSVLPYDPARTFRDEFAPNLIPKERFFGLRLTNNCGVGIFILTADRRVIVTERTGEVHDLAFAWSYSASGSMNWSKSPDPFEEMLRECEEELKYRPPKEDLRLFAVGIDPQRLVFQCSFYVESKLAANEIIKGAEMSSERYQQRTHSRLFDKDTLDTIVYLVLNKTWEPAAAAGLLDLAAKWFGEDAVRAALS
jgi:hypothetical protein